MRVPRIPGRGNHRAPALIAQELSEEARDVQIQAAKSLGTNPFVPYTQGSLGSNNDAADLDTPDWFVGDSEGALGRGDWGDPTLPGARAVLLACATGLPTAASSPSGYRPDLNVSDQALSEYDSYFGGTKGATLKTEIKSVASQLDLNRGLLASNMFAETAAGAYTSTSGEASGWEIGTDSWGEYEKDIQARIPLAKTVKPTGYEASKTNEKGNVVHNVPKFKSTDAVKASAIYLKYAEIRIRQHINGKGGSFDRLPVEYRFALARYGVNVGLGAAFNWIDDC